MFNALLVALGIRKREKKKKVEIVAVNPKKKKGFRKKPMSENIEDDKEGPFERYKED